MTWSGSCFLCILLGFVLLQSLSHHLGTNTALLLKPCRLNLGDSSNFTKTPRQTLSHLYACCCVEHPESSPGHPRPSSSSTFKLHTRNSMGLPLLALFHHLKTFPAQHPESFPTDCLLDSETRCPTIHLCVSFIFTETILIHDRLVAPFGKKISSTSSSRQLS